MIRIRALRDYSIGRKSYHGRLEVIKYVGCLLYGEYLTVIKSERDVSVSKKEAREARHSKGSMEDAQSMRAMTR